MSKRSSHPPAIRAHSRSERREQALCIEALESGKFDTLTDEAWVQLCETVSKDGRLIPPDDGTGRQSQSVKNPSHAEYSVQTE